VAAKRSLRTLPPIKRIEPNISSAKIILIGHSNGGDISMLFASEYPQLVSQVISLDSLRMPFPKNKNIKILTLRAIDTEADYGVLPDKIEQEKFGVQVIMLKNVRHIDLCDRGSSNIKNEISNDILKFLNRKQ
jgi:pimeloyl-ACP methyl ester carboxylesterase